MYYVMVAYRYYNDVTRMWTIIDLGYQSIMPPIIFTIM